MAAKKLVNQIPDRMMVKLSDVLVLYVNLQKAKAHKDVGYVDNECSFNYMMRTLDTPISMKKAEVEALLWACVQLEEQETGSEFWHPNNLNVETFVYRFLHHKQFRFYFDRIYSFFRARKPDQGVPAGSIIGLVKPEGDGE